MLVEHAMEEIKKMSPEERSEECQLLAAFALAVLRDVEGKEFTDGFLLRDRQYATTIAPRDH